MAIQAVTAAINFSKKQAERIRETTVNIRDLNNELDRLARKNNMNSSDGIFGPDKWLQAQKNVRGLKDAFGELDKTLDKVWKSYGTSEKGFVHLMDTLGGESYKDRFNGWDMREAVVASTNIQTGNTSNALIDLFPKLFKENGIDYDMLSEFINSELFGKLTVDVQDYLIEVNEKWETYKEYLTATKDYLADIFGELGNQMTDALVEAFKSGESAAEAFTESVSSMLEQLAKQMIYSVTLAPYIKQAEADMLKVMGNKELSQEQKFEQFSGILGNLVDDAIGQQETANALFEKYQEAAEAQGINIFGTGTTNRSASTKSLAQASQDSIDDMGGTLTNILTYNYKMAENLSLILAVNNEQTNYLRAISENTSKLEAIEKHVKSTASSLDSINTKGVTLK